MALVKRKPLTDIETTAQELENMFEGIWDWPVRYRTTLSPWRGRSWWTGATQWPHIDMYDRENEIVIKADLPGLERQDFDISATEDMLHVKGEFKRAEEAKDEEYYCSERVYGSFSRSVALPFPVQPDKIKATYKNGLLEIHLPKGQKQKGVNVEVK